MRMSSSKKEEKAQERAIDKTIDESKENVRKVLSEVKRELPEVTSTFHDYQEENINSIREMTNTFLESQKEVAKSMRSAASPYGTSPFMFMYWPLASQLATDNYVRAVANIADSSVAAATATNDMAQIAMEAVRNSINVAKENTKALSRYYVEYARSIEEASNRTASETTRR